MAEKVGALRKALAVVLATAALTASAFAQALDKPAAEATDYASMKATPPMWRLADADSEIWLLGTFHILPPGLDWRPDALVAAIDAADTLWFEAEVDTLAAQTKARRIFDTKGTLPRGKTLSALLGPADAETLAALAEELGIPLADLDRMRPWKAYFVLSIEAIGAQGFAAGSGVETVLLTEARARGRDIRFFETLEEQIGFFAGFSPEAEKNLLLATLREWKEYGFDEPAIFDAWRTGDDEAIRSLMYESLEANAPEVFDVIVEDRNERWADEIEKMMAGRGKIVVAVGAGHLVGDVSVPALLEAKGFTVERYGQSAEPAE